MPQNPDAAGTKYRIFKDVIMKLQARAEITGEIASFHMTRLPHPDLGVPLKAIQQLDKFLTGIPHLDTEVLAPPLLKIKNALVELHTDDAGNMRGTTPREWLSDDWASSQHVRVVQDFAELCINCGQEVASYSDEEWQLVADKTSSDWRSVLAEMLRIQACRVDIELSVRKLCKRRLRSLVRTHGVLPFTFNVSGLNMPPHPVSGGGFSIYTGRHPFPHLQDVEVIHHVVIKRERPEIPSNAVEELKDLHPLLKRCWHNNPRQRPNATEISNVLLLEPLEWKKAVEGSTSPFSMLRKLSAPLGQWSPSISLTPQSQFIVPTTTQFISTQVLGSGQSEEASRTIDAGLAESKKASSGQSESGKSSVLLNLRQALTPKYLESERLAWKTVIQLNLISFVKIILLVLQDEWKALEADTPESKNATPLTTEHRRLALSLSPLIAFETSIGQMTDSTTGGYQTRNDPSLVTQVLAACKNEIIALFEDVLVRGVLKSHGVYLQDDCGLYAYFATFCGRFIQIDSFMDDTARISALDYVPTDWDIIRTRKRMPGVEEHRFVTEAGIRAGTEFYITEISGSRSQRSAWIPYLDDIQAILFLAPLIFWQYLDEDPRVNRVQESLDLWREIVGNPLLAKTALIVLFNKKDVLQKHIDAGVKVKKYVPSYGDRPNDVVSVTKCM
ncbi:G-protein alpha subunit-domain-containing protein [Mycena pura]|uniref:G-protein alpha subunit-domain-containing protein n=1 Tax=Mycena pura TaxID=153505 RepID=A0AAD6Y3V5_9AGAR|nr:G-protein alpha subunit-domain-containing protein [Mycena pura]